MGLDISSYRKLKLAPDAKIEDDEPVDWERFVRIRQSIIDWTEKEFPGRTAGLVAPGVYGFEEVYRFRAGSYSGYNSWRDWLARISGWGSARNCWESGKREGLFFELVNFADNEGFIGPRVAAKLARDFEQHHDIAVAHAEDPWNLHQYDKWRAAFAMAADGGAVDFH